MKKGLAFWSEHVAAIKQEGISTSAYAKRHDIALKSLYYWQRKVRLAAAPGKPIVPKTFVALRIYRPLVVSHSFMLDETTVILACAPGRFQVKNRPR